MLAILLMDILLENSLLDNDLQKPGMSATNGDHADHRAGVAMLQVYL